MSMASWKKEFYPKKASKVSKKNALKHSLNKWIGLTKKNLRKHNILVNEDDATVLYDLDNNGIDIDGSSCALCHHFYEPTSVDSSHCKGCILFQVRNGVPCHESSDNYELSPWEHWIVNENPLPMIRLLKRAVAFQEKTKTKS